MLQTFQRRFPVLYMFLFTALWLVGSAVLLDINFVLSVVWFVAGAAYMAALVP